MPAEPRRAGPWLDREAGPVVRPYAVTQGRVAPAGDAFDLLTFVVSTATAAVAPAGLLPEHRAIVSAAWEPVTVVDLAADLDLSVGVVRVLLGDLHAAGLVALYEPPGAEQPFDVDVLEAVIDGLRAL